MPEESLLHKAVRIACEAHAGQSDKQGEPYLFHVFRVALAMYTAEERVTALLHDVAEDSTEWTLERLYRDGEIPLSICDALDALTRRESDGAPQERYAYAPYIERVAANPLARRVKIADLLDHLRRIDSLPDYQADRLRPRYVAALARLSREEP